MSVNLCAYDIRNGLNNVTEMLSYLDERIITPAEYAQWFYNILCNDGRSVK